MEMGYPLESLFHGLPKYLESVCLIMICFLGTLSCRFTIEAVLYSPFPRSRFSISGSERTLRQRGKDPSITLGEERKENIFLDKRGKWRISNPKKLSRKKGMTIYFLQPREHSL